MRSFKENLGPFFASVFFPPPFESAFSFDGDGRNLSVFNTRLTPNHCVITGMDAGISHTFPFDDESDDVLFLTKGSWGHIEPFFGVGTTVEGTFDGDPCGDPANDRDRRSRVELIRVLREGSPTS